MAVLDPPRHEAEEVGRLERRVQAQLFLAVLQGVFESAWERPEDLQRALAELPNTAEGGERRRVLSPYLKALSGCLREGSEAEQGEVVAGAAAQGRRKRGHRARQRGGGIGSDQEKSGTESNAGSEAGAPMIERTTRGETAVSRAKEGRHEGPATRVLLDSNLVGCVIGFLQGPTARQRVKALGQLGSVCRTWREMTCREQPWAEIGAEVMPLSQKDDGQSTRSRWVEYGRMLVAERRVWRYNSWENAMWLQFEVFDARDGLQLLSARGPLWTDIEGPGYYLEIYENRVEAHSTPFSAASRGCISMRHYASQEWECVGNPAGLCVRVIIGEHSTGRKALLWEEGLRVERGFEEWGDEGFAVVSQEDTVVQSTGADVKMKCSTRIVLWPEDDQEGVDERDELYTVCGYSSPRIVFTCEDPYDQVPSLIMSLLRD